MRKKIIVLTILLIFSIAVLSGCTGQKTSTSSGDVKIKEGASGWCSAGTKVETKDAQGQGTYEIIGMTTYKGKSVCEADLKVSNTGAPGENVWKYYFTENNDYAVVVMKDPQGKEQEIVVSEPTGK